MYSSLDDDRFPKRKSTRLHDFDYHQPNYYFVTICTDNKRCMFGEAGHPNQLGKLAAQTLEEIPTHFPGVRVDKYVVMPNHIHAILVFSGQNVALTTVIGLYKSAVSKQAHKDNPGCKIWQSSFHDHIIRNQQGYEQIWLYIDSNPQNWGKDCFFEPV